MIAKVTWVPKALVNSAGRNFHIFLPDKPPGQKVSFVSASLVGRNLKDAENFIAKALKKTRQRIHFNHTGVDIPN